MSRWRRRILFVTLLAGALVNSWNLVGEAIASDRAIAQARQNRFVSPESIFVWGDTLPYELVFPLFTRERDVRSTRIYGLGVVTLAPYSVPTADEVRGQGFLTRLRSQAGIPLIATASEESLLNTYCLEHYGAPLRTSVATRTPLWTITNVSCASSAQ